MNELFYSPLVDADIDELEALLRVDAVYRFIEPTPSSGEFRQGIRCSLAGPPKDCGQVWLHFSSRLGVNGPIVGRLEATIHDGIAETAFLFGPEYWGKGFASQGLRWLHSQICDAHAVYSFWATVAPENHRSESLLKRCGYIRVPKCTRSLLTYEQGDLIYNYEGRTS